MSNISKDIGSVIVSSRVRLARNLDNGLTFKTNKKGAFDELAQTIKSRNKDFVFTRVEDLGRDMAKALYEQHLISKELLENKVNSCIVVRKDNKVCVMLGEEDHMRIQSIQTGLSLQTAYDDVKKIADDLEQEHKIAFCEEFGYITSCPTNLGCGMRASVMMFLPALELSGSIDDVIYGILGKMNARGRVTVRGVYGEGSDAGGHMYQISNQACLGMTEQEILGIVETLTVQIAKAELEKQKEIYRADPDFLVDRIMRSWGLLTNAHMLSSDEAVGNLAYLKLGACLGIVEFKNNRILDDWFFMVQPATLTTQDDRASSVRSRDKIRAQKVAEVLRSSRIK